ncbi:MAG: hypothetical protein JW788_03360, partial [Candidatus Omnitrophica bacterium]|nr:hypothetical protein [Candidatus Omnitrophota bacterium]
NYIIGNIFKEDLKDLWNADGFRQVRREIGRSRLKKHMSASDFSEFRKNMQFKSRFSYCQVCLWRWSMAC